MTMMNEVQVWEGDRKMIWFGAIKNLKAINPKSFDALFIVQECFKRKGFNIDLKNIRVHEISADEFPVDDFFSEEKMKWYQLRIRADVNGNPHTVMIEMLRRPRTDTVGGCNVRITD